MKSIFLNIICSVVVSKILFWVENPWTSLTCAKMQHIFSTLGSTTDLVGRLHTFYLPFLCRFPRNLSNEKQRKTKGTLVVWGIYWWCFILPSYIRIILNHYEDPLNIIHHDIRIHLFLKQPTGWSWLGDFPKAPGSTENRGIRAESTRSGCPLFLKESFGTLDLSTRHPLLPFSRYVDQRFYMHRFSAFHQKKSSKESCFSLNLNS